MNTRAQSGTEDIPGMPGEYKTQRCIEHITGMPGEYTHEHSTVQEIIPSIPVDYKNTALYRRYSMHTR